MLNSIGAMSCPVLLKNPIRAIGRRESAEQFPRKSWTFVYEYSSRRAYARASVGEAMWREWC